MNRRTAPSTTYSRIPIALLVVLAATGCASTSQQQSPFASRAEGSNEITILVRNLNYNEARIWAIRGGRRIRLGTVGGNQDARFTLEWAFSEDLTMEIDLVPGDSCRTRALRVDPGDIIDLQVESNLRMTRLCR